MLTLGFFLLPQRPDRWRLWRRLPERQHLRQHQVAIHWTAAKAATAAVNLNLAHITNGRLTRADCRVVAQYRENQAGRANCTGHFVAPDDHHEASSSPSRWVVPEKPSPTARSTAPPKTNPGEHPAHHRTRAPAAAATWLPRRQVGRRRPAAPHVRNRDLPGRDRTNSHRLSIRLAVPSARRQRATARPRRRQSQRHLRQRNISGCLCGLNTTDANHAAHDRTLLMPRPA